MLITVWISTSLCLPIFLSNHHLQLIQHFKERAETGMKPLGAPFFFAVGKLLIAVICLATWIVHKLKSEPCKIKLINTLSVAKYIQYLGMCSFFCTGISTAIYPLQLLSITVVAEDEEMVNDG